jgi:hypothetical protein
VAGLVGFVVCGCLGSKIDRLCRCVHAEISRWMMRWLTAWLVGFIGWVMDAQTRFSRKSRECFAENPSRTELIDKHRLHHTHHAISYQQRNDGGGRCTRRQSCCRSRIEISRLFAREDDDVSHSRTARTPAPPLRCVQVRYDAYSE